MSEKSGQGPARGVRVFPPAHPPICWDNGRMIARDQLAQEAKAAAANAGFELAGIAPLPDAGFPELNAFVKWIDAGYAGDMKYLEKRAENGRLRRASVRNAADWARSVIVCALNYNTAPPYSTELHDPRRGWVSRYAWGSQDYHDVLLARLEQVETAIKSVAAQHHLPVETRRYVDTGPLVERVYARYAGIGWIGKNTCIINQKLGSWLFLGVILTSLDLAPDLPAADRCGSCTRCIDACPTAAILAPGKLDARRCISYLTIEKRGAIAEDLRASMGHHVFGCDICQDVCPWNNKAGNAPATGLPEFQPREDLLHPELDALAQLDEQTFKQAFRSSPIRRTKFAGLKRNLAIAMGNSGNKAFIPRLERMAQDADPVVAEHARWALNKLSGS